MIWVLIFGGIALAGLVMVVCYAVWLWHKASDLGSELTMLGKRASELEALVSQIEMNPTPAALPTASGIGVSADKTGSLTSSNGATVSTARR